MLKCSYSKLLKYFPALPLTSSRAFSETTCLHSHYDTLKVSQTATAKEIKDAYLKLSKQYHPDRNPNDPSSHDRFVKLKEAYEILSNSDAKKIYDDNLRPSGSYRKHGNPRPYGYPDFSQRDEWLKSDRARRERQFKEEFRKNEDYQQFHQRYNHPHNISPEEMEQYFRFKRFSKSGREIYVAFGTMVVVAIGLEIYMARQKAKQYKFYSPFDEPMMDRFPRSYQMEYDAEKLVNDEKYRRYLNREIEKGNVPPIKSEINQRTE